MDILSTLIPGETVPFFGKPDLEPCKGKLGQEGMSARMLEMLPLPLLHAAILIAFAFYALLASLLALMLSLGQLKDMDLGEMVAL